MRNPLHQIVSIFTESSAYLLLGFLLAGILHVVLSRFPRITQSLSRPGGRPVFFAALLGVPMPLCSCSVLPAAMSLRRNGASRGATASFLVSVPETDVVSILLTFALLGGTMALYRPAAALCMAVAAGLLVNAADRFFGARELPGAIAKADCCHDEAPTTAAAPAATRPWWMRALRYGFVEIFDDIIGQLLIGIAIAGVLMAWLPAVDTLLVARGPWMYLAMLAIGVPLYVCATASTPVAAGLIAGGLSPGAAVVFLLAGPATNIASLFVLRKEFGTRLLIVYLAAIAIVSVAAGFIFDAAFAGATITPGTAATHAHEGTSVAGAIASIVFLLLAASSLIRTRRVAAIDKPGARSHP